MLKIDRKVDLTKVFFIISVIATLYCFYLNINLKVTTYMMQLFLISAVIAMAFCLMIIKRKIFKGQEYLLLFAVLNLLSTFAFQEISDILNCMITVTSILFWIMSYILAAYYFEKNGIKIFVNIVTVGSVILGITWLFSYFRAIDEMNWGYANYCYYVLCAFPIILLCKIRYLKRISIIVMAVDILISQKRTGIICLAALLMIYIFFNTSSHVKKIVIFFIILAVLIAILINYEAISSWLGIDFFQRFSLLKEDSGSSRGELYKQSLEIIGERDIIHSLIGTGYTSLQSYYHFSTTCHNDFIEIILDYGLIGTVTFVASFWFILKPLIRKRKCDELKLSNMSLIVVLIILMMFSHLIIYPSYFIFLVWYLALIKFYRSSNKVIKINRELSIYHDMKYKNGED